MGVGRLWPPQTGDAKQRPGARPPQAPQPKAAARQVPPAPPPYRPQPAPKVLQAKPQGPQAPRPLPPQNARQAKAAEVIRPARPAPPRAPVCPEPKKVVQRLAKPPAPPQAPPIQAQRGAVVQLGKTNRKPGSRAPKVWGISSATNPNHSLTALLEQNPKHRPRLMPVSDWNKKLKRQKRGGYRKYVGIRHRNLETDTGSDELVLVVPLRRHAKIGGSRDRHYQAIEKKSKRDRQTAQNRTELVGEVMAATYMEEFAKGSCKILFGYESGGAGIDQLWVNHPKKIYYVVEAKGPGAKLTTNRFAVRGAKNGGSVKQMGKDWVANRLTRLKSKCPDIFNTLLANCGMEVKGQYVRRDTSKTANYTIKGLVITAEWDEDTGALGHAVARKSYDF